MKTVEYRWLTDLDIDVAIINKTGAAVGTRSERRCRPDVLAGAYVSACTVLIV